MFKKIFKTKKQREQEKKIAEQKRLIKLAEENGICIPPTIERSGSSRSMCVGMPRGWYRSLNTRAKIAEKELKKRGLL